MSTETITQTNLPAPFIETMGKTFGEGITRLGAKPIDTFINIVLPLAKRGYLTAGVLGFGGKKQRKPICVLGFWSKATRKA